MCSAGNLADGHMTAVDIQESFGTHSCGWDGCQACRQNAENEAFHRAGQYLLASGEGQVFGGKVGQFFQSVTVDSRRNESMAIVVRVWSVALYRAGQLALLLALTCGLAANAAAQGTNAAITGIVTDEQGGVLPGVTVTVRNVDTGTVRTVVTEADGQYRAPALLPGRYDITAELAGFTTVSATGITLATSQEVRQNLRLTVATLQESVTVTAEAPSSK